MAEIAPMLSKFGYDPEENPPNYGVPDGQVVNNTKFVHYIQFNCLSIDWPES